MTKKVVVVVVEEEDWHGTKTQPGWELFVVVVHMPRRVVVDSLWPRRSERTTTPLETSRYVAAAVAAAPDEECGSMGTVVIVCVSLVPLSAHRHVPSDLSS
jgi:hypothetical protein